MKPQAERRIRTRLTLEAVAKAENIEVSDEEFDDEIKKMADQYKTPVENIKNYFSSDEAKNDLKADIAVQKAVTLLAENAVEVEKKEEEKKDEAEAEAPKTEA
jgi:trigger factor